MLQNRCELSYNKLYMKSNPRRLIKDVERYSPQTFAKWLTDCILYSNEHERKSKVIFRSDIDTVGVEISNISVTTRY